MIKTLALSCVVIALSCKAAIAGAAAASFQPVVLAELQPVTDLRPLPPEIWSRQAIAYSGFRAGQSPEKAIFPSKQEILDDLTLLRAAGFGLIRVYSSGPHGRAILEVIAQERLDFRVQLGAYLGGSHHDKAGPNLREIADAIELANAHPGIVAGVSVGNEVLVSWSFVAVPPADMAAYIRHVRQHVAQPVTVNDNWAPYAAAADTDIARVWGQIDYASVHTYAYWDAGFNLWDFRQLTVPEDRRARAMMDAAYAYARANFSAVRAALDAAGRRIPIVIGETGWQSLPTAYVNEALAKDFARHEAHPVNQAWYFTDMMAWARGEKGDRPGDGFSRPATMFFFSAFDEPWKNADDNWGLWGASRRPKYVLDPQSRAPGEAVFFRPSSP
jgi:exo-beta-1,3-glucanase (GH17 family)